MAVKDVDQKMHRFPPTAEWENLRLKEIVRLCMPDLGSRGAMLAITNGLVSSEKGGKIDDADATMPPRQAMLVDLRHGIHGKGKPRHRQLHQRMRVVLDDEHVVVVTKRAGTLVQPVDGSEGETDGVGAPLVELLKHYWKAKGDPSINPTVVQRLDKETSGLLVMAKTIDAARLLQRQLKPPRQMHREYIAVVAGVVGPDKGVWKSYFGRAVKGLRQTVAEDTAPPERMRDSQIAETHFSVEQRLADATILRVKLQTGRTHQIRIHCAEAGHPVLGDAVYTSLAERIMTRIAQQKLTPHSRLNPAQEALRQVMAGLLAPAKPIWHLKRLGLHATRLSFIHPATNERMRFEEPIPEDMERAISKLGGEKPGTKDEG